MRAERARWARAAAAGSPASNRCQSRSRAACKRRSRIPASTGVRAAPFTVVLRWRRVRGSLRRHRQGVQSPANPMRSAPKCPWASALRRTNWEATVAVSTVFARRTRTAATGAFASAADRSVGPVCRQPVRPTRVARQASCAPARLSLAVAAGRRLRVKLRPTNVSGTETARPMNSASSRRASDPASPIVARPPRARDSVDCISITLTSAT